MLISKKIASLLAVLVVSLFAVPATHADIALLNTATGTGSTSTTAQTIGYTLGTGNALAIGFYMDAGSNNINTISLGGGAATGIINVTGERTSMAYWFNPSGNNFSVTFNGTTGSDFAYSLYELSGVDTAAGVLSDPSTQDSPDTSTTITTTAASSFLVEWYGANADGTPTIASGPLGNVTVVDANSGAGATGTVASAYATVGAGTYTTDWNLIGGGANDGSVAVAFTAVPEPSIFALFGLGVVGLLARRRR